MDKFFSNRKCGDVGIRVLETMTPFLWFDTANVTTVSVKGDTSYAKKKGENAIAHQNPIEGTMTIEAQVIPFKLYALFGDGTVSAEGVKDVKQTITCSTAGTLAITSGDGETVKSGTVFVYPEGYFGIESKAVAGSFADGTFTATAVEDIAVDSSYEVGYLVSKSSGVTTVSIATSKIPPDYYITMLTDGKAEDDSITAINITAYKASIQRNLDLSFASEGDPQSITLTFDLLHDVNGNFLDVTEENDITA